MIVRFPGAALACALAVAGCAGAPSRSAVTTSLPVLTVPVPADETSNVLGSPAVGERPEAVAPSAARADPLPSAGRAPVAPDTPRTMRRHRRLIR